MRLWRRSLKGGKYLVTNAVTHGVIRAPCLVLGGRDPSAPAALRAYADTAALVDYVGLLDKPVYAVRRRDGTVPHWPWAVLSALDPAAPAALREYARHCAVARLDPDYVADLRALAQEFEARRAALRPAGALEPGDCDWDEPLLTMQPIVQGSALDYADRVRAMADRFEAYLADHGRGDPDAPPHRTDRPDLLPLLALCGSV